MTDVNMSENRMRNDLWSNAFQLEYQPIRHVHDEQVIGFEVLLRWNDAERGRSPRRAEAAGVCARERRGVDLLFDALEAELAGFDELLLDRCTLIYSVSIFGVSTVRGQV